MIRHGVQKALFLITVATAGVLIQLSFRMHDDGELPELEFFDLFPVPRREMKKHNTSDKDIQDCFRLNSQAWLEGPRFSNSAVGLTEDRIRFMLLRLPDVLQRPSIFLEHSLCHSSSRFRKDEEYSKDPKGLRVSTVRLVYLALFYHQYRHAIPEARERQKCENRQIDMLDYECPNAKYVIVSLASIGLGANIRGGAVFAYLAGLVSDRVVLFVNKSPTGHKYLRQVWELASCPRRDYQCFFQPPSPCVLTHNDLANAYSLTKGENRKLMMQGQFPKGHENDKVWHITAPFNPQSEIPKLAAERLRNHSYTLLERLSNDHTHYRDIQQAADRILETDEPRPGYNYGAANIKIAHAIVIYALRPNFSNSVKLQQRMKELAMVDPERTVGLPIRGT